MRMPVVRPNSGPLWVDGSITLRVREKKYRSWRVVKIRSPHAVLGRHPKADLVIDRDDVANHHVFLFLDQRGLFGVDLRTERGTRFAGSFGDASWLGSGDLIEVGDHVIELIQLRGKGWIVSGGLANDDPLGLIEGASNPQSDLTLRLLGNANANWAIGSALVFLGRGSACAVELTDEAVGSTHSAILRAGPAVFLIQFPGETAEVNGTPTPAAIRLNDADILTIGRDSLLVQTHDLSTPTASDSNPFENLVSRLEMAVGHESFNDVGFAFEDHRSFGSHATGPIDYPALIGRLQAETAALVAVLLRRIEALDEEMANLRDRLDADDQAKAEANVPVEKLRWDLIPQAAADIGSQGQSGAWLVDRLRELETERRSTWSNLINRITPGKATE